MPLFDNCIILAPDNVVLSRCNLKKLRWYVDRGLADRVEGDPPTIRLRFEPKGRDGVDDPLVTDGKPNICVVCSSEDNLTRHHIIPYSFIRHMPMEWKVDIIRDIYPLCRDCHERYERESDKKRDEIAHSMGGEKIGFFGEEMIKGRRIVSLAKALLKYKTIPEWRKKEMLAEVSSYLGVESPTEDDLKKALKYDPKKEGHYVNFSERVIQSINNYEAFAKEWREHFVKTMKPVNMPASWSTDRKIGAHWIPSKMFKSKKKPST